MDITPGLVGFQHLFVFAVERTDTEFDLGKIQSQQNLAFGCLDKVTNADIICSGTGHILAVGAFGGEPPGFGSQGQKVGMKPPSRGVDVLQISVNVSTFHFAVMPIFLYKIEQRGQFLAVGGTPFFQ